MIDLKKIDEGKAAVYSVLAISTRWILGSPNFHPMAKFVWESLIDKELKIDLCQKGDRIRRRFLTDLQRD